MPIDPIKIPQNVHIEDRIIGPLTLRQILIVCIGCGFSYALYAMLTKAYGSVSIPITVIVWIPGAVSAVFAFVKFNDLSMLRLILLLTERMGKPGIRTWAPRRGIAINIRTFSTPEKEENTEQITKKKGATESIHELSAVLDKSLAATREQKAETPTPLSPLEEQVEPVAPSQSVPRASHPVDRTRITASPLRVDEDIEQGAPPTHGSVSLFRDLSPRSPA